MAPRKILAPLVVVAILLVSGSLAASDELGGTVAARGVTGAGAGGGGGYLGDTYIGCLEMGFSACYADPTLVCVEDAMVECSLRTAAAAPAATGAAAPAADQAGLVFGGAIGGVIARGVINLGVEYLSCVDVELARNCLSDPTTGCVEGVMGGC